MCPVQKINFKSNGSNLMQNFKNVSSQPIQNQSTQNADYNANRKNEIINQPAQDVFQRKENSMKTFVKEYGGIAAIVMSIIGIPAAYFAAQKSSSKIADKINTDVSDQIGRAVEKALANAQAQGASKPIEGISKTSNLTSALLGLGGGAAITQFIIDKKADLRKQGYTDEEINAASDRATKITDNSSLDHTRRAEESSHYAERAAQAARQEAYNANNALNSAKDIMGNLEHRINELKNETSRIAGIAEGVNPTIKKYTVPYYGLNLLQVLDYPKKIDKTKTDEAVNSIRNAAQLRTERSSEDTIKAIKAYKQEFKELTSLWSLTAEYAPMKTGGLGVVPVDLQNNFTKLGIDSPTFIPMYLKKNQAEFRKLPNGKFQYNYNGNIFELRKIAATTTHVFRNGETKPEKIEYYMTELNVEGAPDKKKRIIFVKSGNYFNENIYDSTTNAEETERFALFTKAVYKLAKLKVNMALNNNPKAMGGVSDLEICDEEAFNELKAPNSMILNDWHAGSMAGLLRYRAPMEYNYKEIPARTYKALKDMPLLIIGHNLGCQGKSNDGSGDLLSKNKVTENIINTLYDSYAIGIAENAHSGIVLNNDDMCNTVLMKRSTDDKHFNHLFNGVALSDWFVPVSKNYANEIVQDPNKSGILYPLLTRRQKTGTTSGITNGLDKDKVDMNAVANKNFVKGLSLEKYDQNTDIDEIMQKRTENKRRFYRAYIKPLIIDKTYENGPEIVRPEVGNMNMSEDEFVEAPLISFAHRLTSQKGLAILKGAIFRLFDNWETKFPGKPMPYFLVGGPSESAEELQHLDDLKNPNYGTNKARVDHVIALKGNLPNPAIMSASTYFCGPSTYEPCGLIQGESFAKGTPVIVTDTGGFHDTVEDKITGFIAPEISEESYYNKLVEALELYYNAPDKYKEMVQNDLKIDFSWVQPNGKGPFFEYTDKLGYGKKQLVNRFNKKISA